MGWGIPRRPKLSSKIGRPAPREGSDGDIQIRGTNAGAQFFAKWAGRWLGISDLIRGGEDRADVFTVKAWQGVNLDTEDDTSFNIVMPNFITKHNYLGLSCAVKVQDQDLWFIDMAGGSTAAIQDNYCYSVNIEWAASYHRISVTDMKSTVGDETLFEDTQFFVTVFFKG